MVVYQDTSEIWNMLARYGRATLYFDRLSELSDQLHAEAKDEGVSLSTKPYYEGFLGPRLYVYLRRAR
jgi:hypothetical protein